MAKRKRQKDLPEWMRKTLWQRFMHWWLAGAPSPWYWWLTNRAWYKPVHNFLDLAPLRLVTRKNVGIANLRWDIYVLAKRALIGCPCCPRRPSHRQHKFGCREDSRKLKTLFPSMKGW